MDSALGPACISRRHAIASMPNPLAVLLAIAVFSFGCAGGADRRGTESPPAARDRTPAESPNPAPGPVQGPADGPCVEIRGTLVRVETAVNDADRAKGLGYRDSLPEDRGMLFIYPGPRMMFFWMKGMRFPIDIVWIRNGVVVDIHHGVEPEPSAAGDASLKRYYPKETADSVLETNAGFCRRHGIVPGDAVSFRPGG